jgi:hypothetical protein
MRSKIIVLLALLGSTVPAASGTRLSAPVFSATVLRGGGGEPAVSISPSGKTVLVDGLADSPASLFRSTDYGVHFAKLSPHFDSAYGGDWDMRFLDERTIVAADLGAGINVDRSTDAGVTWTTTNIEMDAYDRPWIEHYGRDIVYLVAKGFDGIPYLYTSSDGGRSFGSPPLPILIYGTGTDPAETGGRRPTLVDAETSIANAYVDHLTVDPRTGDVYVLYGISGADSYASHPLGVTNRLYVAHLEDGRMWSNPIRIGGGSETYISGFNWMTIDSAGTLYVLANGSIDGHHSVRLTTSRDKGRSWSPLVDLGAPGAANVFGSIAGAGPGMLSLAYLRGSNEDPSTNQNWFVEMATVERADTPRPLVLRTRPVRAPVHQKDICFDGILCGLPGFGRDRSLLDFLWNAVSPDGRAYAAIPSDGPATGGGDTSIILLRQTGGTRLGRGAPS